APTRRGSGRWSTASTSTSPGPFGFGNACVDPFVSVARALDGRRVRYVVIGVWGANYYAHAPDSVFTTEDRDLFLPLDAENLLACWDACEAVGLELKSDGEPLDEPRDQWLAERVVERRAVTRAADT